MNKIITVLALLAISCQTATDEEIEAVALQRKELHQRTKQLEKLELQADSLNHQYDILYAEIVLIYELMHNMAQSQENLHPRSVYNWLNQRLETNEVKRSEVGRQISDLQTQIDKL